jgi:hypothetical protein
LRPVIAQNQLLAVKFPMQRNREFSGVLQGKFLKEQGNFRSSGTRWECPLSGAEQTSQLTAPRQLMTDSVEKVEVSTQPDFFSVVGAVFRCGRQTQRSAF